MDRAIVTVGTKVSFGRRNGATAYGIVTKVNPKTARVKLTEQFNSSQPGDSYSVPYALLREPDRDSVAPAWPVGRRVVGLRTLHQRDMAANGWEDYTFRSVTAIVFDDGSQLFASCDEEGNGPGALFGVDHHSNQVIVEAT